MFSWTYVWYERIRICFFFFFLELSTRSFGICQAHVFKWIVPIYSLLFFILLWVCCWTEPRIWLCCTGFGFVPNRGPNWNTNLMFLLINKFFEMKIDCWMRKNYCTLCNHEWKLRQVQNLGSYSEIHNHLIKISENTK